MQRMVNMYLVMIITSFMISNQAMAKTEIRTTKQDSEIIIEVVTSCNGTEKVLGKLDMLALEDGSYYLSKLYIDPSWRGKYIYVPLFVEAYMYVETHGGWKLYGTASPFEFDPGFVKGVVSETYKKMAPRLTQFYVRFARLARLLLGAHSIEISEHEITVYLKDPKKVAAKRKKKEECALSAKQPQSKL